MVRPFSADTPPEFVHSVHELFRARFGERGDGGERPELLAVAHDLRSDVRQVLFGRHPPDVNHSVFAQVLEKGGKIVGEKVLFFRNIYGP